MFSSGAIREHGNANLWNLIALLSQASQNINNYVEPSCGPDMVHALGSKYMIRKRNGLLVCPVVPLRSALEGWLQGDRKGMPFAIPRVQREPTNHTTDCYFRMVDIQKI